MNFLKNNQKFLTYPKVVSLTEREWISYNGDSDNPIIKDVENILHITFNKNRR